MTFEDEYLAKLRKPGGKTIRKMRLGKRGWCNAQRNAQRHPSALSRAGRQKLKGFSGRPPMACSQSFAAPTGNDRAHFVRKADGSAQVGLLSAPVKRKARASLIYRQPEANNQQK